MITESFAKLLLLFYASATLNMQHKLFKFVSDPLGADPNSYLNRSVDNGCHFRDFNNYTYFGVPEFATEYIQYKGIVTNKNNN